jgi:hypothetical protein
MSLTLGFLSIHATTLFRNGREDDGIQVLWWLVLYALGLIGGLAGLFSLVVQTIHMNYNVLIITAVFGSVLAAAIVLFWFIILFWTWDEIESKTGGGFLSGLGAVVVGAAGMGLMGALYSDWILAAIANNMTGVPTSDNAVLYYIYFAAKRLTLFSS